MPIRRSPNGAGHTRPQPGRDRPEWVVAINRNARSQSIGIGGRNQPVRAINLISNIRNVSEVAAIYCATGNPVQVIVTKAGGGCSVIGIVDGLSPRAIESEGDKKERTKLLRDLGYKRS